MNKQPDPATPSRSSVFVKDVIIAGVFGAVIFLMPLLHDALAGGTASSNPLHFALVGGSITFVGLLAFLQLPTKLFVYVIPVLVLVVAFLPSEGPELKDLDIQPEVPALVQPDVTAVQPEVVAPPVVVQPEIPAVVQPDTSTVQPETPIDVGPEVPQSK